ncbi:MAG: prepilin-type N-terminal cleavage/methylation domain-containing protein [bacterium]|nr:prepilin-type N-terminal cleavage/methylation domain-containing protein [bacterium]
MRERGFTLVELLVVTGIIMLFSAFIFPNFNMGEKNLALERSSAKLAQDLGRVRSMAMSAKKFTGAPSTFRGSYGIKFETNFSSYILFADLNNNQSLDLGETVETILLEKNIKIGTISPSPLIIIFTPPNPSTNIISTATIVLTNSTRTKNIEVNKAGLINIK